MKEKNKTNSLFKKSFAKKDFLKSEYKKSFDYIKTCKNYIYSIIAIFFIFALIGYFIPVPQSIAEHIMNFIKELIEKTQGMSQLELIKFIFLNNIQSSFFGMIFGGLFGLFSVLVSVANGYLVGFVVMKVVEAEGFTVLWKLFPHGIFELPAIFISLGLGLKFGTFIFQKHKAKSFREFFRNSLRVFLYIVIPLLIAAAVIEGSLMILIK